MSEPERIIGNGDMNVPFEVEPTPDATLDLTDAILSGGLVCMAAAYEIPGAGHCPAVVFRFTSPEGEFYNPMVLVMDPLDAQDLGRLVTDAANAAIRRSAELGGSDV